jgi:tRNA (guanine37-N1)-methyltransferase
MGNRVRFTVVTIFPEFFDSPLQVGLLGKAVEKGLLTVDRVQVRDFTTDRHRTVDDTAFGGGPGMVMMVEPLVAALEEVRTRGPVDRTILLSPRGRPFDQERARELAGASSITLVCGRYEGIDERLLEGGWIDEEISLGDFVLNGGEVAALAIIEACSRLLPGAMGNEESVPNDSFFHGLLDHPHYTRPREFRGMEVPPVLLSGNHAEIDKWRRTQALKLTARHRPDLLEKLELSKADRRLLES